MFVGQLDQRIEILEYIFNDKKYEIDAVVLGIQSNKNSMLKSLEPSRKRLF